MPAAADDSRIRNCVEQLYGREAVGPFMRRLAAIVASHTAGRTASPALELSERDAMLIAYPDIVNENGEAPLRTLAKFARLFVGDLVSGIHILPFFPSSSDDGFAVRDYRQVDPSYGSWSDVQEIGHQFELMFDAVINHASAKSQWFKGFLQDEAPYKDFFITVSGTPDLSSVVRPRTLPLVTTFETAAGPRRVWTTFSADQADLNYHNPEVLLAILDLLLFYVDKGATWLRLDAIAYAWKDLGTPCIHRPRVHTMIQLMRSVMEISARRVRLVTETNVPHEENIQYLGDGHNEAHALYNFTLPPLLLHAFQRETSVALTNWAEGMEGPTDGTVFLNVLATHDGIGLNGLKGFLPEAEIAQLIRNAVASGARISEKANPDGSSSPYELNANYFDALGHGRDETDEEIQVGRFLTAHAIMLSLKGVPGIYFHSLFGSRGWNEGVTQTGQARAINRERLRLGALVADLNRAGSLRGRVYRGFTRLLRARGRGSAFAPGAAQQIVRAGDGIFALRRVAIAEEIWCVHNISSRDQRFVPGGQLLQEIQKGRVVDLLDHDLNELATSGALRLAPYDSVWLRMATRKGQG